MLVSDDLVDAGEASLCVRRSGMFLPGATRHWDGEIIVTAEKVTSTTKIDQNTVFSVSIGLSMGFAIFDLEREIQQLQVWAKTGCTDIHPLYPHRCK